MTVNSKSNILLVCGMPATGKSTFGNWLRDTRGYLHLDLELCDCLSANGLPLFWSEQHVWNLDSDGLSRFIDYLRKLGKGVVMTWAFHTDLIDFVHSIKERGVTLWWFEGDRLAGRTKFEERGQVLRKGVLSIGTSDAGIYDWYVESVVSRWAEIEPLVRGKVIRTLSPDGTYLDPEEVYQKMHS